MNSNLLAPSMLLTAISTLTVPLGACGSRAPATARPPSSAANIATADATVYIFDYVLPPGR